MTYARELIGPLDERHVPVPSMMMSFEPSMRSWISFAWWVSTIKSRSEQVMSVGTPILCKRSEVSPSRQARNCPSQPSRRPIVR